MDIYEWKEGMTSEESKNGAYWERNMLALFLAKIQNTQNKSIRLSITCGWYYDVDNNWDGWKRVISLFDGQYCFHIPDDFDIGNLEQIKPCWDGHSTKEKWTRVMNYCGCEISK